MIHHIDASMPPEAVHARIMEILNRYGLHTS